MKRLVNLSWKSLLLIFLLSGTALSFTSCDDDDDDIDDVDPIEESINF